MRKVDLFVVLLASCVGLCFSDPASFANDLAVLRLCNASSPVSLETVNSVLIHRDMHHPQAQTEAFKCFLLCLYTEYGWMDHDGGFELHSIKTTLLGAQVPKHRIISLLYACTSTESANPCDRATIFTECFWSHNRNESEDDLTVGLAMK